MDSLIKKSSLYTSSLLKLGSSRANNATNKLVSGTFTVDDRDSDASINVSLDTAKEKNAVRFSDETEKHSPDKVELPEQEATDADLLEFDQETIEELLRHFEEGKDHSMDTEATSTTSGLSQEALLAALSHVQKECVKLKKSYSKKKKELRHKDKNLVRLAKHMAEVTDELKDKETEIEKLRVRLEELERERADKIKQKGSHKSTSRALPLEYGAIGEWTKTRMVEYGSILLLAYLTSSLAKRG